MLKLDKITFAYNERTPIFDELSLTFDTTSTAIIGQNGAGKSTLVKLIKKLLTQQSGEVVYRGKSLSEFTTREVAQKIGLVFQNPDDQIFKNTVMEEVLFGPLAIGKNRNEAMEASTRAIDAVGLTGKEQKNPYDLSLSDRKMIAIASILAMDTEIVIFDEPTIAQDKVGKERIKAIIQELEAQGKLVLAILHDMDFVATCFERTIILAKGEVLYAGETRNAFDDDIILQQAKLEKPHILQLKEALKVGKNILTVEEFVRVIHNK